MSENGPIISVPEAANLWGVDQRTVRRWCKQGRVECSRLGTAWVIHQTDPPEVSESGRPRGGIKK